MTEAEWLACADPDMMLDFLRVARNGTARKTRLFVAACFRRWWPELWPEDRAVVEASERYADGLIADAAPGRRSTGSL